MFVGGPECYREVKGDLFFQWAKAGKQNFLRAKEGGTKFFFSHEGFTTLLKFPFQRMVTLDDR